MNDKIFNLNFIKISLACIFLLSATQIIMVVLPLFMEHLGNSPSVLGIATSLSALAAMIARPVSGYFADKKGKQVIMVAGLSIMAASMMGFHFLPLVAAIIIIRSVQGFGFSVATTCQMAIVTDVLPASQVKKGLAYFGICMTIAVAFGPTIGLALVFENNYMPAWIGGAILYTAALIIVATIKYDITAEKKPAANENAAPVKGIWRYFEKDAMRPSLIFLVITIANSGAIIFLPVYAAEINIENVGLFYILQACSMFLSNILVGKTIDRLRSPLFLLLLSVVCFGIALFTLFMANGTVTFALAAVLYGFGLGTCTTIVSAVTMSSTAPERRGAASATFQIAQDMGFCIGAFVWGVVAGILGYRPLYGIIALLPILAAVMCLLFFVKKKNPKAQTLNI